jgi:hypothetical protein
MSEEQREILQMLSEGKLDVEAAERLLAALEAGRRKDQAEAQGHSSRTQAGVQDALSSVREVLAGIGPMVGRIAGEISTEFQKERNFPGESEAEELPDVECEGNRFRVAPGQKLYIRNDRRGGPGGGDLSIVSVPGEECTMEGDQVRNLRVLGSSSGPVIRWSGNPLRVAVPSTVSELYAYTLGGDAEVGELHCPVRLTSMGGDLQLSGLKHRFKAKTMGGNIRLGLGAGNLEDSEAKTMGGNIRVDVSPEAPCIQVVAVTMCGNIVVDDQLGHIERKSSLATQKMKVNLGSGPPDSALKVKTMGGNIEVRRISHE